MNEEFAFSIGNIKIMNNLVMAPMDGFTDMPFRKIVKKLGAGIVYSEFINGLDVINKHPFLEQKITFCDFERPFAYQIFDDSPERILKTALILEEKNPDFIDINLGCSAKNVANRGAGAGLLRTPQKIERIFSLLIRHLSVPVTAKIRLGWDDNSLNYLEISKIIQESGASLITVHGRTKQQGYSGEANWAAIAEIKSMLTIPVIANGDVFKLSHIKEISDTTNCDGIMIGRGALSNPWIFQKRDMNEISFFEKKDIFIEHFQDILNFYGQKTGMVLFRKHIKSFFNIALLSRDQRINLYNEDSPTMLISLVLNHMEQQMS